MILHTAASQPAWLSIANHTSCFSDRVSRGPFTSTKRTSMVRRGSSKFRTRGEGGASTTSDDTPEEDEEDEEEEEAEEEDKLDSAMFGAELASASTAADASPGLESVT